MEAVSEGQLRAQLMALYPAALTHQVYITCSTLGGDRATAEDLTADVPSCGRCLRQGAAYEVSTAWLVTIARHRLVDHWRREERLQLVQMVAHSFMVNDRP
ncbi:MAG: hypothetical protein R2755_15855 [Acidimicrobiales bacterium]